MAGETPPSVTFPPFAPLVADYHAINVDKINIENLCLCYKNIGKPPYLFVAKSESYGVDKISLNLISNCLSNR